MNLWWAVPTLRGWYFNFRMLRSAWWLTLGCVGSACLMAAAMRPAWAQAVPEPLPPVRPSLPVAELPSPPPVARPPSMGSFAGPFGGLPGEMPPWFRPIFSTAPHSSTWLRVDYLNWHIRSSPLPDALLTTSDLADQGRIGAPSTHALFGGQSKSLGAFSGVRLTGGAWFTQAPLFGAEFSVFALPGRDSHFQVASSQVNSQLLALPFLNQTSGTTVSDAIVIAQPGSSTGYASAFTQTSLWGIEGNALRRARRLSALDGSDVSLLGGIRFLQLNDRLNFSSFSSAQGGINRGDDIHTQSSFIGLQIGARAVRRWGRFSLFVSGKTAFGATNDLVTIGGHYNSLGFGSPQPSLLPNGNPTTTPADLTHNYLYAFSVVPEVQARLSYDWRPRLRLSAGYDFLYWTRLVRPGDQIDTRVNLANPTSALAAPIQPVPLDQRSDFWLRGWSVSLTYHY